MAIFEIEAPNGKILEIEGDMPPSEVELDEIFAKTGTNNNAQNIDDKPIRPSAEGVRTPEQINDYFKQNAQYELAKRKEFEENHPVLTWFNKDFNPSYRGRQAEWEQQAKYGIQAPIGEQFKTSLKQFVSPAIPAANMVTALTTGGMGTSGKLGARILGTAGAGGIQSSVAGGLNALGDKRFGDIMPQALSEGVTGGLIGGGLPIIGGAASLLNNAKRYLPLQAGASIAGVKPDTLMQAVKPYSKALDLNSDQAKGLLNDTTLGIRNAYTNLLRKRGEAVGNAAKKLSMTEGVPINSLRSDLDDIYNSYSLSGDKNFNKAFNEAGDIYEHMQEVLNNAEIPQAQIDKNNFIDMYNNMLQGRQIPNYARILSETPEVWQKQGVPNKPIVTSKSILEKMGELPNRHGKNHHLSDETIKQLPELLYNPEYIFKSNTEPGRFVGALDAVDNEGRQILGILNPSGDINFIPSAYGRNNFGNFLQNQRNLGNLLYERTASAPTIGVGQAVPNTSINDLPKNVNISATKLYETLHGNMPKIRWDDVNAGTKNQILERIYGKFNQRLSNLSPELKSANKAFGELKRFEKNEGLEQILKPGNKIDKASTALKNYNSSVTKGNTGRNIQDLENILTANGEQPFLNTVDDINAAMDLNNSIVTGRNFGGITDFAKSTLVRPVLKGIRNYNRFIEEVPQNHPLLDKTYNNVVRPAVAGVKNIGGAVVKPLLYRGYPFRGYVSNDVDMPLIQLDENGELTE